MQPRTGRWGSTTALGLVPAWIFLFALDRLLGIFASLWMNTVHYPGTWVIANSCANLGLLGLAMLTYLAWVFGTLRGWITCATGGGFVVMGSALVLRIVVEFPQVIAQTPLAVRPPPEPYATVLVLGRYGGLVAYAMGLAFVVAAVVAERRLRRAAPSWAIPP